MRINRYLASAGVASRRASEDLIRQGRVTVNGVMVSDLSTQVDPGKDHITVDGKKLKLQADHCYVILNKPRGIVCTSDDPEERVTVMDMVSIPGRRLFTVGRLDAASEGLILLTDDGELALRMTHPRYGVEKQYKVWVHGRMPGEAIDRMRAGIFSEGETLKAGVQLKRVTEAESYIRFVLHEGKKHHIRRMCDAVGFQVKRLMRVGEGPLSLGDLKTGQWRVLEGYEAALLRESVGLK